MSREFKLPDLGEGVHEGQVLRVLVREGDLVAEDQPLIEIETDKAAVEIPSPFSGIVQQVHVRNQQLVHVGDVMVTFGEAAPPASLPSPLGTGAGGEGGSSVQPDSQTPLAPPVSRRPNGESRTAVGRRKPASPAVRRMAREQGIDIETIDGTGPGGRVTRADVQAALSPAPWGGGRAVRGEGGLSPSPLGRGVRGEGGTSVSAPSQPVQEAIAAHQVELGSRSLTIRPFPPPRSITTPVAAASLPEITGTEDADQYGPILRQPISQARKTIARVMTQSLSTIPHVTDCNDADITELDRLRREYEAPSTDPRGEAMRLSILPFVIRAVVKALQMFPMFNASWDEDRGEIIYKRYYNIAIGVQTQRGLIAPVIRNADRLSIPQVAQELAVVAENARTARFEVNDTRGGTYTISNAGAMGPSRYSTPIISPPQVAVLALGRSRWMPWVVMPKRVPHAEAQAGAAARVDPRIEPRLILPLSHSMDHRVIDGAAETAFMQQFIADLENPMRLLL